MFICFKGDIQENRRPEEARDRFASLFSISSDEVGPLFRKEAVFIRQGLDRFAVDKYRKIFQKAGVRFFIGDESAFGGSPNPKLVLTLNTVICPRCKTEQTYGGNCLMCPDQPLRQAKEPPANANERGIGETEGPAGNEAEAGSEKSMPEAIRRSNRIARRVFRFGGLLMLAIFMFDEKFREFAITHATLYLDANTKSVGWLPYFLVTLYLTYGCYHYVRVKGYSPWFAFLGLTSLFGMGIIILLPNKRDPEPNQKPLSRKNIAGVVFILISLYWAQNLLMKKGDAGRQLQQPVPLSTELETPDDESRTAWPDSLEIHERELWAYVDDTFALLSDYDFEISETEQISDRIYLALSNFCVWLDYQHYLFIKYDEDIPENLGREAIEKRIEKYILMLREKVEELDDPLVQRAHVDWTMGYIRENDKVFEETVKIGNWMLRWMLDLGLMEAEFSELAEEFDPENHPYFAEMSEEDDELSIRFRDDLVETYAGKTIRFATWIEVDDREREYTVIRRIGGNIWDKYLNLHPKSVLKAAGQNLLIRGTYK